MESSTEAGLTVIYDEETNIFTFEWDENLHPEYNYIKELTSEKFSEILKQHLDYLNDQSNKEQATDNHTQV